MHPYKPSPYPAIPRTLKSTTGSLGGQLSTNQSSGARTADPPARGGPGGGGNPDVLRALEPRCVDAKKREKKTRRDAQVTPLSDVS